jgi:hypothetical protein
MCLWHEAHSATALCFSNCWRIVVAPRISGSIAPTSGGGGAGGVPRIFSSTHLPRRIGDVVVPLAVTFKMLAWVSTPPR